MFFMPVGGKALVKAFDSNGIEMSISKIKLKIEINYNKYKHNTNIFLNKSLNIEYVHSFC